MGPDVVDMLPGFPTVISHSKVGMVLARMGVDSLDICSLLVLVQNLQHCLKVLECFPFIAIQCPFHNVLVFGMCKEDI